MITLKTTSEFSIRDKRGKVIGNHIIYLKVDRLIFNETNVSYDGYYYIVGEENTITQLDFFAKTIPWESIENIEISLNPLSSQNLRPLIKQRVLDMALIQLTIEEGENYGTTVEDWIEYI